MPTFAYEVRDRTGRIVKGTLEGEGREAVSAKLREMGYIILNLEEKSSGFGQIKFGTGVKTKDLTVFSRQFATMINAGLSLTKCLAILGAQTESAALREIVSQVGRDVEAGQSLSEALAKHPRVFPPIFINMVRAGETGGVLDEVLLRLADHFENEANLRSKIKSAMTYPIAMGVLVLLILIAMMVFVVPTFEGMFASFGGELPAATRLLVNISNTVRSIWGLVFLVVVIVGWFGFRAWKQTETGKFVWDSFKLRLPVVGPLVRKMALARFTRTFGTLVSAGVPILSALDIVGDTAGNEVIGRAVRRIRAAIKEGETIAKPLSEHKVFPAMLVQMISVGEETGALDAMLNKVADFYDNEVSAAVEGLTSLIEPIMMAGMGIMVGGIVIALYMPMFQIVTVIE
ncbi:MAG: type II secretion system F family protein [Coriobacteriia bacterium]